MDVSNARWQDFILAAAGALAEKGFDGFFIDNTDVYYNYPTEEIYQGIVSILSSLTNFGKDIVINGGDVFVRRYIEDGMPEIFSGVNQENVFTAYDFGAQKASLSTEADRDYYTEYLNFVEAKGYDVFILEYAKSQSVAEEAQRLAEASGWTYYISDNIDLRLNK